MTNDLLVRMFSHAPLDQRIIVSMMEELLGEKRTQKVLDGLFPSAPIDEGLFEGRRIDEYRGLSRAQLKSAFSFSDATVDELYERMGVDDNSADVDGEAERDDVFSDNDELESLGGNDGNTDGAGSGSIQTPPAQ